MKQVTVAWQPELDRFEANGHIRDQPIAINAPHEGRPAGFSASDLLLASIGGCSAWDVVQILDKQRQKVASVKATVTAEQAEDPPWRFTTIDVHFEVGGEGLRQKLVERAVRLSCDRYCSVIATVRGVAEVTSHVTVVDAPLAAPAADLPPADRPV